MNNGVMNRDILEASFLQIRKNYGKKFEKFIREVLEIDPEKRKDWKELKKKYYKKKKKKSKKTKKRKKDQKLEIDDFEDVP